ncbi:hypothetical protein UFOVP272_44 [uncultured Caudovirales phage]|uniref:Uncharacterized protein n=1 Tax=uncultured Caudovirales phage TaxID=2100421 RepID=A0A6J5LRK2_9CAUD|nr:hypothetical protein UFOVP272_44 [uncultured Caudovirales phage]
MNTEDDEFNRIEMESKVRQEYMRQAMEKGGVSPQQIDSVIRQMPKAAWEPSHIPLITDEEWNALNAKEE